MKMSPKLSDPSPAVGGLFCLPRSHDPRYPNRLQVQLPRWSVDDVDLRRWILGFGAGVKVITPVEMVDRVRQVGEEIVALYDGQRIN
ncbi:MAG: WYL domain-containing protein [Leptolyngbyaceae cyanobacterium SM2_5_2]|nr:WYL domain-containing protein [Leptolyngbyaceae cyanobacterium SM2_5_2]